MPYRVTLIPGDGTGPELTEATRRVLEATGVGFEWDVRHAGVDVMAEAGTPLPDETLASVKENKVALKEQRAELQAKLDQITAYADVFARAKPVDKITIVRSLQRQGHISAMTGDGVNDVSFE